MNELPDRWVGILAGTAAVRAPQHLSPSSKALYRELVRDFQLDTEPHALRVLTLAREALDRCEQARIALARHGTTSVDRFGQPRERPEVGIERDSRIAALRSLRELSLDAEVPEVWPPRIGTGVRS